jgi:hypothetical protein
MMVLDSYDIADVLVRRRYIGQHLHENAFI